MIMHDLTWFLNQVCYLDWIRWNLELECVIDLKEWCYVSLPKLVWKIQQIIKRGGMVY